jgi:hypothetical protein
MDKERIFNKDILSFFTLVLVLSYYLLLSVNIRPIADDYCAAAGSASGVFAYINNLALTWSGDYTQILFNGFLVAFPLSSLPMYFLGLQTLFLFMLLLVLLLYIFYKNSKVPNIKFNSFAILSSLVLIVWNIYWALPAALSGHSSYDRLLDSKESFSAVFGWPTVIVQYLTVPICIVLLGFLRIRNSKLGYFVLIATGLIIGTSGYALALAIVLSSSLFLFYRNNYLGVSKTLTLNSGVFVGATFSYFSPGAQLRSESFALQDPSVMSVLRWLIVSSLEFTASIFNVGIFFVVLVGFLTSRFVYRIFSFRVIGINSAALFKFSSTFLLVYFASISVSEFLTYNAFWHLITFRSFLFFYVFFVGVYLGKRFSGIASHIPDKLVILVGCCLLLSAFFAIYNTNSSIVDRRIAWSVGPAGFPGISDISPEDGWVDVCWDKISDQDKYPVRD